MARPRRPWLAALLSLLGSPGLGQLYNGSTLKAAVFLLGLPPGRERVFIKRAIGLPGETIELRGKTVYADGKPLTEAYASFLKAPEDEPRPDWGPALA